PMRAVPEIQNAPWKSDLMAPTPPTRTGEGNREALFSPPPRPFSLQGRRESRSQVFPLPQRGRGEGGEGWRRAGAGYPHCQGRPYNGSGLRLATLARYERVGKGAGGLGEKRR